jgi:hypothetical protein
VGLHLNWLDIHYARNYYHVAGAYNEIGLTIRLNRYFGLGTTGEKIGWNKEYPEWGE